jgi:hypothetical protein
MRKAFAIALILLAGCAKRPEEIKAVAVSDLPYRNLNCQQIRVEYDKTNQALFDVSRTQHAKAEKDAFGVFMVGVPVGSIGSQDYAPTIAGLKGQLDTMAAVGKQKGCPPFPEPASNLHFEDIPPEQQSP